MNAQLMTFALLLQKYSPARWMTLGWDKLEGNKTQLLVLITAAMYAYRVYATKGAALDPQTTKSIIIGLTGTAAGTFLSKLARKLPEIDKVIAAVEDAIKQAQDQTQTGGQDAQK